MRHCPRPLNMRIIGRDRRSRLFPCNPSQNCRHCKTLSFGASKCIITIKVHVKGYSLMCWSTFYDGHAQPCLLRFPDLDVFARLDEKNAKWSHVCGCIAATESAPKSQKATIWTLWVDPKPMFWSTGPTQANRSAADMPHFGRALAPIPKTRKVITWESRMVCGCIAATCSDP